MLYVASDPDRVYKLTHSDNFGCFPYFSPHDPDLTGKHFHGTGNANPLLYMARWILLNDLGGYKTRFGSNPTMAELSAAMSRFGCVEISRDAYLRHLPEGSILLTDAAPRNVRIIEGIPILFDAIAMVAPARVLQWARKAE